MFQSNFPLGALQYILAQLSKLPPSVFGNISGILKGTLIDISHK